jgi:hypothetical protein
MRPYGIGSATMKQTRLETNIYDCWAPAPEGVDVWVGIR